MGVESTGQLVLGQKHDGASDSVSHCRRHPPLLSLHFSWKLTSYSGRGLGAVSISSALGTLVTLGRGRVRVGVRISEQGRVVLNLQWQS